MVSVVIPTKDRWPLLRRALRSALDQEDIDVEVLVVDDGSTDETPDRLAELDDRRLRVLRHDASQGVARARNRGIAEAHGTWVAFLDDDDVWAPRKLVAQVTAAGTAGWSWTAALVTDEALRPRWATPSPDPAGIGLRLLSTNPIPALSSVAVRADVLRATGGFDEAFSAMADWDLWIRLGATTTGSGCPEPLVGYVDHGTNMLAGAVDPQRVRPEFDRLAAKHAAACAAAGVEFGAVWWGRWIASNHRFQGRRFQASRAYLRSARRHGERGDVARALGALGGQRAWQAARGVLVGSADEPAWIDRHRAA